MTEKAVAELILLEFPEAKGVYVDWRAYTVVSKEVISKIFDKASMKLLDGISTEDRWIESILADSSAEDKLREDGAAYYERTGITSD